MRTHNVGVIPGDGIGPELIDASLAVLDALQKSERDFRIEVRKESAGAIHHQKTGSPISDDTVERLKRGDYKAMLKGPVGLPDVRGSDGTEAGLLGPWLRAGMDAYADIRPIRMLPGVKAPVPYKPGEIDYVIVRENTEGLYASRGRGVMNKHAASDILFMTRPGVERIVRFAFRLARSRSGAPLDHVKRVTCVDKSNVLRSFAFWRGIFTEVAAEFPNIATDFMYVDAMAEALVLDPRRFDVVVMENFLGDILSDLGGGTVGGIGMCPSGNVGDSFAYFEPIHGSAPTIAGQDLANPISQILSLAMLLDHLGEAAAAKRLFAAVSQALERGDLRVEGARPVGGTRKATAAIISQL